MDTKPIILMALHAQAARQKSKLRRDRISMEAEFGKFCSGGMLVFVGLLLGVIYCLLTRRV